MSMLRNGVGAAIEINGIAVPMDSFVKSYEEPVRGAYSLNRQHLDYEHELNGIPLSQRSWWLLNAPIPVLTAGAR